MPAKSSPSRPSLEHLQHQEKALLTLVARFLEYACPDHHIRGGSAHIMARHAASRLLQRHPEIARHNLYTAVVCGEENEVRRILEHRPEAATEKYAENGPDRSVAGGEEDLFKLNGPKCWEPLLYLCFTRLPVGAASDQAVAIAGQLLDRGANPNAYFMAGGSRYTPLVGVIGEGEEGRPPHPQRDALTRLLLERGAEPFDQQVIYNTHFEGDVLWFLKLIYEQSVHSGRKAAWADPAWTMLDMGGYGSGARFLFNVAIRRNDLALAEWMLKHGADPNAGPPRAQTLSQQSLYEEAVRNGSAEMAELLARHGAIGNAGTITNEDPFATACARLNRALAQRLAKERPDYLLAPGPLMKAARFDQTEVVALLLDLGMSPNMEDPAAGNQRALHVAAYSNAAAVVQLLIQRGAEVDFREARFGATALGFAVYGERWRAIEVLSQHSRDVWQLVFLGKVARLEEILTAQPELARVVYPDGETALMHLPDNETAAREIVQLWLARGADPKVKNKGGFTAADLARQRGMDEVAALLNAHSS